MSNIKSIIFAICLTVFPVGVLCYRPYVEYIVVLNAEHDLTTVSTFFLEYTSSAHLDYKLPYLRKATPGIMAYANCTEELEPYLKMIVPNATTDIPAEMRSSSPLTLVGSTSFRKLSNWNQMVDIIVKYFKSTGLRVDPDSVSLMEGRKIIFIWLTVNLLLGRLHILKGKTTAILELGGVSSRVAYEPQLEDWLTKWQWKSIVNVTTFGRQHEVYRYSYYRLGINEARVQILELDRIRPSGKYESECVFPLLNTTWTYKGQVYHVIGAKSKKCIQKVSKKICLQRINEVLDKFKPSPSLNGKEVYGTSYYYSVAVQAKMVNKGEKAEVTLNDIYSKARKYCKTSDPTEPFLCMDLLYVHASLSRMYNLTGDSTIHLVSKINRFEVTWPLGFALHKFEQGLYTATKQIMPQR